MTLEEANAALSDAWPTPPPIMPEAWADPSHLEWHDAYLALSGKSWQEIDCSCGCDEWLSAFAVLGEEVPRYYTAAAIRCSYEEGINDVWLTDFLHMVSDQFPSMYSLKQCRVILQYLIDHGSKAGAPEGPLVEKWRTMVTELSI